MKVGHNIRRILLYVKYFQPIRKKYINFIMKPNNYDYLPLKKLIFDHLKKNIKFLKAKLSVNA